MADDVKDEWAKAALAVQPHWHARDIKAVIAAVAPLIRAAERDACAQLAFDTQADDPDFGWDDACLHIVAAIRARGADDGG